MTNDEALKIAQICRTADNGCFYCAMDLADRLSAAFPEIYWPEVFIKAGLPSEDAAQIKPYEGDWQR